MATQTSAHDIAVVSANSEKSWRVRCAIRLERIAERLSRLPKPLRMAIYRPARLICQGMVMGLLRPDEIDQYVEEGYRESYTFYDPQHYALPHDEAMLPTLKRLSGERTRLLDAFCGQGREARILAEAGYVVTGVDRLESMIDGARRYADQSGFDATFQCADFDSLSESKTYEIVYTSCWMYSTCQGSSQRITMLNKCRRLCDDDGLVVVSFDPRVESFGVATLRHVVARVTGWLSRGNRKSERGDRIASSGLFWHCMDEATMKREVGQSELRIVEVQSGQGDTPTFVFLSPKDASSVGRESA